MEGSMGNRNEKNKLVMIRISCECASLDSIQKNRMGKRLLVHLASLCVMPHADAGKSAGGRSEIISPLRRLYTGTELENPTIHAFHTW